MPVEVLCHTAAYSIGDHTALAMGVNLRTRGLRDLALPAGRWPIVDRPVSRVASLGTLNSKPGLTLEAGDPSFFTGSWSSLWLQIRQLGGKEGLD